MVDVQGSILKSLSKSHDVTNEVTTWMVDVSHSTIRVLISHVILLLTLNNILEPTIPLSIL